MDDLLLIVATPANRGTETDQMRAASHAAAHLQHPLFERLARKQVVQVYFPGEHGTGGWSHN